MATMIDSFTGLLQSPIGTILLLAGVAFGVYYIITRFFWKKDPDKFEVLTFEEVVLDRLDNLFKFQGLGTRSALVQGFDFLGDVDKWVRQKGQEQTKVWDEKRGVLKPFFKNKKPVMIEFDLYVFRIKKSNFIFQLLGLGKSFYAVVDSQHLANLDTSKAGFRQWNIKPNVMFLRWGGAYITSESGQEYLSNFSVVHSHENMRTYSQEYLKSLTYYYPAHAMKMEGYERKKKVDSKAWERYKRADEVEDDDD